MTYPGFVGELSASMTLSLGISPSVISVSIPPTPSLAPRGTVTWIYNDQVVRVFPNCVVKKFDVARPGGYTIWNLTIHDRREEWKYGQISGEYNIRGDEGNVTTDSRKKPDELAALCLNAMGETGFDVSILVGNGDLPYIKWELQNPAKALADLLDEYSCTVSLQANNTVKVVQLGIGANMPFNELTSNITLPTNDLPSSVRVVTAPTEWQYDLRLTAVGPVAEGGDYDEIYLLPYMPAKGWNKCMKDFAEIDDETDRKLAQQHIWRSYRVEIEGLDNLPETIVEITERSQILPLLNRQLEREHIGSVGEFKPSVVYGKFRSGNAIYSHSAQSFMGRADYKPVLEYDRGFSVDEELGIVHFSQPVNQYVTTQEVIDNSMGTLSGAQAEAQSGSVPASIYLRCMMNVYDKDTREVQRYFASRPVLATSPSQPDYKPRYDITLRYRIPEVGANWFNTKPSVEPQLDFYLDEQMKQYQTEPSGSAEYAGFLDINTDGKIRQVTYSVDGAGFATTRIEYNQDNSEKAISFKRAREIQRNRRGETDRAAERRKNNGRDDARLLARAMRRKS